MGRALEALAWVRIAASPTVLGIRSGAALRAQRYSQRQRVEAPQHHTPWREALGHQRPLHLVQRLLVGRGQLRAPGAELHVPGLGHQRTGRQRIPPGPAQAPQHVTGSRLPLRELGWGPDAVSHEARRYHSRPGAARSAARERFHLAARQSPMSMALPLSCPAKERAAQLLRKYSSRACRSRLTRASSTMLAAPTRRGCTSER